MTDLAPIAGKLANCIRLLASDKDGEVVAAVRAMIRTLQGIGADIHDVADRVEHTGDGAISKSDMQAILDKGIEIGRRQAQATARTSQSNGYVAPQLPPARDMAMYCYQRVDQLNDWEHEFITNMASWARLKPLSPKQQAHLEKIYLKLGGKV